MSLNDIHNYIDFGKKPFNSQIMNEIDYLMRFYKNQNVLYPMNGRHITAPKIRM